MSSPPSSVTPTFARFDWYWQPVQWLENMSPQDAVAATEKAINIQEQEKALKLRAQLQEKKADLIRQAQQKMLDSLNN